KPVSGIMADRTTKKTLFKSDLLVSSVELAEVTGIDFETINNWIRRRIIQRAQVGGRHLRNRLFSVEEVYRTALKNELVKLGIQPSVANDAINLLWREWLKQKEAEDKQLYVSLFLDSGKWVAGVSWRKTDGGSFYKLDKHENSKLEEMKFPDQAIVL